jgi:tRNA U34 2-thiouridine synthase MnmA/TrmU
MRALALISGGLDSLLAVCLMREQGIEVTGIKFKIPFCPRSAGPPFTCGIEVKEVDIGADFLNLIRSPRYGFGAQMNPCIDCKILMFAKAGELFTALGASFAVTGEVLGQRPMSQHRQALLLTSRRAGLEGLVLRPLSAQLLPETVPEKEGWVARDRLLGLSGRARKAQFALAEKFGIRQYAQPAGGCLLTDPGFARRLHDLCRHQGLNLDNVELLKSGRHFRLSDQAKLAVGRNETENNALLGLARAGDYLLLPDENSAGPAALGRGEFSRGLLRLAAGIVLRYCDKDGKRPIKISCRKLPGAAEHEIEPLPLAEEKISELRI